MAAAAPTLADANHPTNPRIPFSSFGLWYELRPDSNLKTELTFHVIRHANKVRNPDGSMSSFKFGTGAAAKSYTVTKRLGAGTYGEAYEATGPDGRSYAIKYIKKSLDNQAKLAAFLREAMIQIMIVLYSEGLPNGPYAPRLYHIGYDSFTSEGFICSELMYNRMDNLILALTPADNNVVVPNAFIQIADILEFLKDQFQFNHRDLKADNIMYSKRGAERLFRLIDFGFSCLTWNGVKVSGSWWFDSSPPHKCFKVDRDMAQLVYENTVYRSSRLSPLLLTICRQILQAIVNGKKCQMVSTPGVKSKHCSSHGLRNWKSSYDFVDRSNVQIPYGTPSLVKREMENFLAGRPFGTGGSPAILAAPAVPEPPKICPPGKIYNPRTRRCVKAAVVAPGADPLLAPCPPGKIRNPVTRRCVKNKGPDAVAAVAAAGLPVAVAIHPSAVPAAVNPCPPNKVLNPATGNCVLRDGALGKKILAAAAVPAGGAGIAAVAAKVCPPGKVLNPATGNCVLRDGALGKKLLAAAVPVPAGAAGDVPVVAAKVCPPGKILNPATGNCVLHDGAIGKKILAAAAAT